VWLLGGAVAGQRWVSQSRALRRAPADASAAVLRQLAEAVADALRTAGGAPVGAEAVRSEQRADGEVELRLDTGSDADGAVSALFAECLEELLLPLGEPRWLVSRTVLPVPDGPAARRLTAARAVGRPVEVAVTWHAVPSWLSRSRSASTPSTPPGGPTWAGGAWCSRPTPRGSRWWSCCAGRTRSR
jgi:hypothetical protein